MITGTFAAVPLRENTYRTVFHRGWMHLLEWGFLYTTGRFFERAQRWHDVVFNPEVNKHEEKAGSHLRMFFFNTPVHGANR